MYKYINMKSSKTTRLRLLLQWGIFLLLLVGNDAFAQTKVSGKIINERTSAPASGATITVKKSNRSTVADEAGGFIIDASTGDVLVITMVGYVKKEITIGKNNVIQVKLTESASQLEDVVVIGYGKAKRKDLTGSITSISGEELRKSQPATFDQALQGKIAGAVVQQVSGQPGAAYLFKYVVYHPLPAPTRHCI
jgi:TonB-dependent starch-binding outer membrane protein SusC